MIAIQKSGEPESLTQHRRQENAKYTNLPTQAQSELREKLLIEQGYLCCYCMSRISEGASRIEHFLCKKYHPEQQLEYANMLAACNGNTGKPYAEQHCDVRKGKKSLSRNPADPQHPVNRDIHYLRNGIITSDDDIFNKEISDDPEGKRKSVLNLNYPRLVHNRRSAFNGLLKSLDKLPGGATPIKLKQIRDRWSTTTADDRLPEYCGVALYYLDKRLRRAH
jgi:uncharacterized protein (TIGR02646 family)